MAECNPQTSIPFELINIQHVGVRVDFDDRMGLLISGLPVFAGTSQLLPVQEASESDDIDARVEARLHQLIARFPSEIRDKIDIPLQEGVAISDDGKAEELEMPEIAEPVQYIEENTLSVGTKFLHFLRLMGWYFVAPQKLSRFCGIFLSNAPSRINALLTNLIFILLVFLAIFQIDPFNATLLLCWGSILIPVATGIVSYGSSKNSYLSFFWSIGRGLLIIVFLMGIIVLTGAMSSLIYYVY